MKEYTRGGTWSVKELRELAERRSRGATWAMLEQEYQMTREWLRNRIRKYEWLVEKGRAKA